jgi:hypothetical protein
MSQAVGRLSFRSHVKLLVGRLMVGVGFLMRAGWLLMRLRRHLLTTFFF